MTCCLTWDEHVLSLSKSKARGAQSQLDRDDLPALSVEKVDPGHPNEKHASPAPVRRPPRSKDSRVRSTLLASRRWPTFGA
jgi:hypothetical protein